MSAIGKNRAKLLMVISILLNFTLDSTYVKCDRLLSFMSDSESHGEIVTVLKDPGSFNTLVMKDEHAWVVGLFSSTYTNDDAMEKILFPQLALNLKKEVKVGTFDYHDLPEEARYFGARLLDLPMLLVFGKTDGSSETMVFEADPDGTLNPHLMAQRVKRHYLANNSKSKAGLYLKRAKDYEGSGDL
mmetsp:Transcript_12951/g.17710  ORF Transcript_12951/g.17710 Transcript_12951/m.17710 type:complete len:187 (-) Transcript_12951:153-713(-)|eukprot:CAMPEP_0196572158 /NCGR_PEP_ID=MMETSP1081-20130531/2247_1 /TAXON_ID=36882 /ORGANISM="Pyramimonas amylifera, Strain CCMP720" /LENGTH=186 /DNA_ID=CAMNT_0041889371 /DNA_START=22 /DNA_END=582 /DNA_ORIENTATION=+